MDKERELEPFEFDERGALKEVERHFDQITERHAERPKKWLAFTVAQYESGNRSVAIVRPDETEVGEELHVLHGPHEVPFASGPGVLAVLLRGVGQNLRLEWPGVSVEVEIEELG